MWVPIRNIFPKFQFLFGRFGMLPWPRRQSVVFQRSPSVSRNHEEHSYFEPHLCTSSQHLHISSFRLPLAFLLFGPSHQSPIKWTARLNSAHLWLLGYSLPHSALNSMGLCEKEAIKAFGIPQSLGSQDGPKGQWWQRSVSVLGKGMKSESEKVADL